MCSFLVGVVAVELAPLHGVEEGEAGGLGGRDEDEAVEAGALRVGLGGDDHHVQHRGDDAAQTLVSWLLTIEYQ